MKLTERERWDLDGLTAEQLAAYWRLRKAESHNMAMVLLLQQAPGQIRVDERWALADGGRGKYQPGLAEYTGDPFAYCSSRAELNEKCGMKGARVLDGPMGVPKADRQAAQAGPVLSPQDRFEPDRDTRAALAQMAKEVGGRAG